MSQILPWLSLVAIIWLQAMSGTNTDFPAYSSKLKIRLHITQVQLNNLAVASDSGKLFGFLSGIAASFLPLSSVLIIGSTIGFIGYGVQFLFLTHKISHLAYWQYLILQVLAGHSVCWINTACYVSSMRKFPKHHGIVVGLATSYTGLSAKIYIALAKVVLGNNFTSDNVYLMLNASVPLMLAVLTAPLLVEGKPMRDCNGKGLMALFVIAVVTGVYAVIETLVPVMEESSLASVMLLVMILVLVLVPVWMGLKSVQSERMQVAAIDLEVSVTTDEGAANEVKEGKKCETGSEHGAWKLITCMDFWVYFLVYLFGGTMGLVYANNLGQVANSRGVKEEVLLSVSSTFGFFGKLSAAPLSLFTRSKYKVSRPAFVAALMVPMAASFYLLLIPTKDFLFLGTAVIGVSTGAITSIAVSMTADLFGPDNFSVNHNIVVANIPVGSLLFGYTAALLYDQNEMKGGLCVGMQCFRTTFIIWGSICTLGTVLSFVLYLRTRRPISK